VHQWATNPYCDFSLFDIFFTERTYDSAVFIIPELYQIAGLGGGFSL
jgi:hypothetical protein